MDHKILPLSLPDKGYISCDEASEKATCKIQNRTQKSQGESDPPSTRPDVVSSAATAPVFQNKLPETFGGKHGITPQKVLLLARCT